jgi:hypothetical protein
METAHTAPGVIEQHSLAGLTPVSRKDFELQARVEYVLRGYVVVECAGRRGVLDLNEGRNNQLRQRPPRVGDTFAVFILSEDVHSGNLLLAAAPPRSEDPWAACYRHGSVVKGNVTRITADYIEVTLPYSTTGRIGRDRMPQGMDFDRVARCLRVEEPICCSVVAVVSRKQKRLDLAWSGVNLDCIE